jgi:hypothetical protein
LIGAWLENRPRPGLFFVEKRTVPGTVFCRGGDFFEVLRGNLVVFDFLQIEEGDLVGGDVGEAGGKYA